MIFVGDIAHPFKKPPPWLYLDWPWSRQEVVANLEGALVPDITSYSESRGLFNHDSVLDALSEMGVAVVSLANNHITDVADGISRTIRLLQKVDIQATGVGRTLDEAGRPGRVVVGGQNVLLLAFGWEAIECDAADHDNPGVSPLRAERVLRSVRQWGRAEPEAAIVVLPHWNYSAERYPQPAHRQLAREIIDAGADAVIGHHPHCVGGVELYHGRVIAYSLGNWWLPQGVYCQGRVSYPSYSRLQLALEWAPGRQSVCHWFEYQLNSHALTFLESEAVEDSDRVRALTPFSGMNSEEYLDWFRAHRVKRKGLPIYVDYRTQTLNSLKDQWVAVRHRAVLALERFGLRETIGV